MRRADRSGRPRLAPAALVAALVGAIAWAAGCSSSSSSPGGEVDDDAGTAATASPDGSTDVRVCDPVKQDCPDAFQKCTYVASGSQYETACVTSDTLGSGDKEGEACTGTSFGHDSCESGQFCSGSATPDRASYCRRTCAHDSDCGAGTSCATFTTTRPSLGICLPVCAAFGGGCPGGTCGETFTDVDGTSGILTCRPTGTAPVGTACDDGTACANDTTCAAVASASKTCLPLCDQAHACKSGNCTPIAGFPTGTGVCH